LGEKGESNPLRGDREDVEEPNDAVADDNDAVTEDEDEEIRGVSEVSFLSCVKSDGEGVSGADIDRIKGVSGTKSFAVDPW
jgi:hypothetical protein